VKGLKTGVMAAVGVAIGGGLLWYALRAVDVADLRRLLRQADWWLAGPFLVMLFGFCAAKSARWSLLLKPVTRTRPLELLPVVVVGYAGAILLPLQLGELVRSAAARRRLGVSLTAVLASIAVERTFDLLFAAILLGLALATNPAIAPEIGGFAWILGGAALGFFALLHAYASNPQAFATRALSLPRRIAPRVAARLEALLLRGSAGAQAIRSWPSFFGTSALSLLQITCTCVCVGLSFVACGIAATPSAVITVVVLATVGMSLPSAPAYVGSIQAAYVVGLAAYGVAPTVAVTASLYYHVLTCGSLLLGAIVCAPALRARAAQPTSASMT
jgi:uncharacterized protein (TIRG00374 family)